MAKLTLAAVAASCIEVEVSLAGQVLRARPLSAVEMGVVMAAFPQPEAPLVEDLNAGSLAPKIPDHNAPAHKAAVEAWVWDLRRAVVAMGVLAVDETQIEVAPGGGGCGKSAVEMLRVAAGIVGACRHGEVLAAFEKLTAGGKGVGGDLEGN